MFVRSILPNITSDDLDRLLELYPDDPTKGAPYDTGDQYQLAPEFKRLGSLACDLEFDSLHRLLGQNLAEYGRTMWSYCECIFVTFYPRCLILHYAFSDPLAFRFFCDFTCHVCDSWLSC